MNAIGTRIKELKSELPEGVELVAVSKFHRTSSDKQSASARRKSVAHRECRHRTSARCDRFRIGKSRRREPSADAAACGQGGDEIRILTRRADSLLLRKEIRKPASHSHMRSDGHGVEYG